ncbi:MAG: AAA family ATPase [Myxococcota bacterium]
MSDRALPPLSASVKLLVRELASGDHVRFPVAEPTAASIGSGPHTQEEQTIYLAELLSRSPPSVVARFLMPEATSLVTVEVQIPREGLPRKLEMEAPIAFACVVVPGDRGRWVFVPRIQQIIHVPEKSELEEVVKTEIARLVGAKGLSGQEYLDLLPGQRESLETLTVELERRERNPEGRAASLHRRLLEVAKKKAAIGALETVGRPMARIAGADKGPDAVGVAPALESLGALLGGTARQSVLLLGPELAGKSALFQTWYRREGRQRLVYATSGAQLIAGMSGLGQWQERVRRVFDAAELLDAILYFDDLADLFNDNAKGWVDLASAIRPYLQDGRVRVVGELSPEQLSAFEGRDVGFFAALARVRVAGLDQKGAKEALLSRLAFMKKEEPDAPSVSLEAITTLLDLAQRYLPYRPFPGKAVRLLESTLALAERSRRPDGSFPEIGPELVLDAFSLDSGIPTFLLREDRALFRGQVIDRFRERLIGQTEAIERVVDTICVVKAGLQPTGKPLASFLFIGPTGVGKTELARSLADFLFGSPERLIRFDMSEYADPLAAERLIRGTAGADGLLTRQIRQQPFSVLLLDEIEKAHGSVFDLLLQVAGEGRLTDAKGRTTYFHNTIIVMTSNLGAAHRQRPIGIGAEERRSEDYYQKAVDQAFRPEFVNRLDRIIVFSPLSREEVRSVADIAVRRLGRRRGLSEQAATLDIDAPALSLLAEEGYAGAYGARALRRHLDDALVAPAARLLSAHPQEGRGAELRVRPRESAVQRSLGSSLEDGSLRFQLIRADRARAEPKDATLETVLGLRRELARARASATIQQTKEQIDTLVAQLAQLGSKKDRRSGVDAEMLRADLGRLQGLWDPAERAFQDLLAAEELAMRGYFLGQDPEEQVALAKESSLIYRRKLVFLFVASDPDPSQILLRVREMDEGRPLSNYLPALLAEASQRGWAVTAHLRGDKPKGPSTWPPERPYGPPRTSKEVMEQALSRDRRPLDLLLFVDGPHAGSLLALEDGLHRLKGEGGKVDPSHFLVSTVLRRTVLADQEWLSLFPHEPPAEGLGKRPAQRELDRQFGRLRLGNAPETLAIDDYSEYWDQFLDIAYLQLMNAELQEAAS